MLVPLRYLAILGWMKDIPSSLANLSNLETFLLTMDYYGSGQCLLPDSFLIIKKLRDLHVHGALIELSFPKDKLQSSINLYSFCSFSTPKLYVGQNIEKMMRKFLNIRNLKCSLQKPEESTGESNKIVAMDFLSQLESLKLPLGNVTAHHLEFHLPLNLKKLTLVEFSRSIIPTTGK
ncbi:hypothetical protein ACH5RR_021301 [Cinchona calisaya]|uniref:Uncharacterized protein n=1 Tax=Cinchona calisaya TaxID=153742 RepID=A0ABD2ZGY2_9GENT